MVDAACRFLKQYNATDREPPDYTDHAVARSVEKVNLRTILLATTNPTAHVLRSLVTLARHQEQTRPRLEVIEHVQLSRQASDQQILADISDCYGDILNALDHYDDAFDQYTLPRKRYLKVPDLSNAALSLLDIASISVTLDGNTNEIAIIQKARQESQSKQGVLRCISRLGCFSRQCLVYRISCCHRPSLWSARRSGKVGSHGIPEKEAAGESVP
ncbi:hypothetical protein C8J56DRAFT_914314 [Mycena floridula]|nr:hypothetical protein C8J56DRAFT_914314 [Mycena floridula]